MNDHHPIMAALWVILKSAGPWLGVFALIRFVKGIITKVKKLQ